MRGRFEFAFHLIDADAAGAPDAPLTLLGSQGWEIRGLAPTEAGVVVALQRPLDEEHPLAESAAIAATLEEPLAAPGAGELDAKMLSDIL